MASLLGKIVGDFTTQLATAINVGGTSATLQSSTDDDGNAIPNGRYFFTIDGDNSRKEHVSCSLGGTSITNIKSITRQGTETSGVARAHRIGATVIITDFKHIKAINDLLDGTTDLNASVPLKYDGTATINNDNMLATKAYVDGVAVAGAPDASTTAKGLVEIATQAEVDARTATGGTGAKLAATPDLARALLFHDYQSSSTGNDSYAITCTPAVTAYTTGDVYIFKADVANTGAASLNVNSLGAKTIVNYQGNTLLDGDIEASQIVMVVYDGTNMQMVAPSNLPLRIQNSSYTYAASSAGTDSYAITLNHAPTAYATGQIFVFKTDVANTGAATLNVNSLGAKTIKKMVTLDLETGDIAANQVCTVAYDGTNMQLLSVGLVASPYNSTSDINAGYYTNTVPFLATSTSALVGWTCNFLSMSSSRLDTAVGSIRLGSNGGNWSIGSRIPGIGSAEDYSPANTGKILRLRMPVKMAVVTGGQGFGITDASFDIVRSAQTDVTDGTIRFVWYNSTLYAHNANGTTATSTNVTSGVTGTSWNDYLIIYTPGTNALFYINGTLVATHTTNLPTTGVIALWVAYGADVTHNMNARPLTISMVK